MSKFVELGVHDLQGIKGEVCGPRFEGEQFPASSIVQTLEPGKFMNLKPVPGNEAGLTGSIYLPHNEQIDIIGRPGNDVLDTRWESMERNRATWRYVPLMHRREDGRTEDYCQHDDNNK